MPLRMPVQHIGARLQQALEPHAIGRGADFVRVGRADRGQRIGGLQPGLEEADAAEVLDRASPAAAR